MTDFPSPELVRATLRQREESAQRVFAVGRMRGDEVEMVRQCGWCAEWIGPEPEGEHVVTTGICKKCKAIHFPEVADE